MREVEFSAAKTQEKYQTVVKKLPMQILNNGLAQSLAFLQAKGKTHHKKLYGHLRDWLVPHGYIPWHNTNSQDLLARLLQNDSTVYRHVTQEALAFTKWLGNFADASLPVLPGVLETVAGSLALKLAYYEGDTEKDVKKDVKEEWSDKTPPGWSDKNIERILIDKVLGKYEAGDKEVRLYEQGLCWAARELHLDQVLLARVVRTHEAVHALVHLGRDEDGNALQREQYDQIPIDLKKTLAQLITYQVAKTISDDLVNVFNTLNEHQPQEYRQWEPFKDLAQAKISKTIVDMRAGQLTTLEVVKAYWEERPEDASTAT